MQDLTVDTFALGRTGSGTKLAKRLAKGRPCSDSRLVRPCIRRNPVSLDKSSSKKNQFIIRKLFMGLGLEHFCPTEITFPDTGPHQSTVGGRPVLNEPFQASLVSAASPTKRERVGVGVLYPGTVCLSGKVCYSQNAVYTISIAAVHPSRMASPIWRALTLSPIFHTGICISSAAAFRSAQACARRPMALTTVSA